MSWTLKNYRLGDSAKVRRKHLEKYAKRRGKQKVINELQSHSKFFADMPGGKDASNKIYFDAKWLKKR